MDHNRQTVGIAGIGCYIPQNTISSDEIAEQSGIPAQVITEKIGMAKKPVAESTEQPSAMAFKAASAALEKAELPPEDLDIIIYTGSTPQDYLLWSAAGKLQNSLGAGNAFAFEITNGCNGMNLGMQVAKDLLLGNPRFSRALVVAADKYSPFLDYTRTDDLSLFHISDAAVAAVLRKNEPANTIIAYHQITDGSYADYVKIRSGGTVNTCSTLQGDEKQSFSVEKIEELAALLTEVYTRNYIAAIHRALEESGHTTEDVDFLFTNQVKASTMNAILEMLKIPPSKTFRSIVDYGHMGTVDTLFALSRFLEAGRISAGNLVVLASSAVGFSWSAMVLQF